MRTTASLLCFCALLGAANLLVNGDFSDAKFKRGWHLENRKGKCAVSPFTEDKTWNPCLKYEVAEVFGAPGARRLSSVLTFGGEDGVKGVPVKPDTWYRFSMEVMGTTYLSLNAFVTTQGKPKPSEAVRVKVKPASAAAKPDAWTKVEGTFKTPTDAKYARLALTYALDEQRRVGRARKPGDYVLIDNVCLEEKPDLLGAAPAAPAPASRPCPAFVLPSENDITLHPLHGAGAPLPARLALAADQQGLRLRLVAEVPQLPAQTVAENGKGLWQDLVLELFFAPPIGCTDRSYTQFAIASGGGRLRMLGPTAPDGRYAEWQGACRRDGKTLHFEAVLPWNLLGYSAPPAPGEAVRFNVGGNLPGKSCTLAPIRISYNDRDNFATLIVGSVKEYCHREAAALREGCPTSLKKQLDRFAAGTFPNPTAAVTAANDLRMSIAAAKQGDSPFLAATLPLTGRFALPLEIAPSQLLPGTVKLRGAIGEVVSFPLVICNRTSRAATYRILVHNGRDLLKDAEPGGLADGFPEDHVILREAVAVKDGEDPGAGAIYDALPRMNEAQTITVPARDCALAWIDFDLRGVKPGDYTGAIRVIPLLEPASITREPKSRAYRYRGAMRDYPLALKVLPFELPHLPKMPMMFYALQPTRSFFEQARTLSAASSTISVHAFAFKFAQDGTLLSSNCAGGTAQARERLQWFREAGADSLPHRLAIMYGAYTHFAARYLPKGVKPLGPVWEKCWRTYLLEIDKAMRAAGAEQRDYAIELVDEPFAKDAPQLLAAARVAHETLPGVQLMISWGWMGGKTGFTPDHVRQFLPYVHNQTFNWRYRNLPDWRQLFEELRGRPEIRTGMYVCSKGIRLALHDYYRLHPWWVRRHHIQDCHLWCFVMTPRGGWDWKLATNGAITYRAGATCIPSIRMAALRLGIDDQRYLEVLEQYRAVPEVASFLEHVAARVTGAPQDTALPDRMRDEVIRLLLKHQKP